MSIAGPHGAGYVKVSSKKSRKELHKKIATVEAKRGTGLKWRILAGTAKMDAKQTSQLLRNIKASHLYPMAKVARVEDSGKRIVFDAKCSSRRVGEVGHWVIILNGDGNESAQVVPAFKCAEHGLSATVPEDCKFSSAKLKGALICFGPQPVARDTHEALLENTLRFPKAKQAIQLLPDSFARLQRACS